MLPTSALDPGVDFAVGLEVRLRVVLAVGLEDGSGVGGEDDANGAGANVKGKLNGEGANEGGNDGDDEDSSDTEST